MNLLSVSLHCGSAVTAFSSCYVFCHSKCAVRDIISTTAYLLHCLVWTLPIIRFATHAPFDYDVALRQCVFHLASHRYADEHMRIRVLTYEDSARLRSKGVIEPVPLPNGLLPDDTRAAKWAAALRLCGHDVRKLYAHKAAAVKILPPQLLPFVERKA